MKCIKSKVALTIEQETKKRTWFCHSRQSVRNFCSDIVRSKITLYHLWAITLELLFRHKCQSNAVKNLHNFFAYFFENISLVCIKVVKIVYISIRRIKDFQVSMWILCIFSIRKFSPFCLLHVDVNCSAMQVCKSEKTLIQTQHR